MRIILNAPGIHHRTKEAVESQLEELTPRLKRILFQFRPEEKTLRVHLAQQKNNTYRLTMSIRMPSKNILIERTGHALIPLVTEAKQALLEQVKVQTSVIRREHLRAKSVQQGQAVREAVDVAPTAAEHHDEEELKDRFSARLGLVLEDLRSHVSRLIRSSQLAGDLQPGYLKPGEVVNEVILRAYEIFRSSGMEGEISPPMLYQQAEKIILDEIRGCEESEENVVSMEAEPPHKAQLWDVNDSGEELLGYAPPEESLVYEEIMPDVHLPDPVRAMTEEEQMEQILTGLSGESPHARSAFLLDRVEGFEIYEIAWIQERTEAEVLRDIKKCEERLKEAYLSSGKV